jgi:hypothetical protein
MSSLLSAISGQFSKSVLLGAFFPVVLFIAGIWLLVLPMNPAAIELLHGFDTLDTNWKVLGLTLVVVLLTGTLYNLNTSLIRLYEGYPWKESAVGKFMTNRQVRRLETAAKLLDLIAAVKAFPLPAKTSRDLQNQQNRMAEIENKAFPSAPHFVLPTRFGNVIRNAETYPKRYGIDAIEIFPRIAAKIDASYVQQIDDAKTQLDFMVHCSILAALLGYIVLLVGSFQLGVASTHFIAVCLAKIAVLLLLSYLCYLGSMSPAGAWGMNIKAVFDLYRASLFTQLGYDIKAVDDAQERELWNHISTAMVFPNADVAVPARRLPYAISEPIGIAVAIVKSTDFSTAPNSALIQVAAQLDDKGATRVTVYDSPPAGMELRLNTLKTNKGSLAVTGSAPLRVVITALPPGCTDFTLTYEALVPGTASPSPAIAGPMIPAPTAPAATTPGPTSSGTTKL